MVGTAILSQVKSLSAAEKLELIGAVWETLSPQDAPVTEEEKRLIDSRLEDMKTVPEDQSSWAETAARLRHQLR